MQYNIAVKRGETMAADGQKPGSQQAGRGSSFIARKPCVAQGGTGFQAHTKPANSNRPYKQHTTFSNIYQLLCFV